MFIKDNINNHDQKHRIETRAAATPTTATSIVDSGFSQAELNHIKAKVYEALPTKSKSSLFRLWIDNLFIDPQQSGLNINEFNRILSVYKTSHRTKNIIADIIEGIKRTDFNTPENSKVMSDNTDKIMSGEWTYFDLLNNFNVVSGAPVGVMGPLNHYLNAQITKPNSTDAEVATTIIKDCIDSELKKYGVVNGLLDTKYTLLLNNYLDSSDFTNDFKNIIDKSFASAESLDSTLTGFIKYDSLKALLIQEVKNELTNSNITTHLAGNFYGVLKLILFTELEKILPNAAASITKAEADVFDQEDKLTLNEITTLLPGAKEIFDKYTNTFDLVKFTGKYNMGQSHIILNANFFYPSALSGFPLFESGHEPNILVNDNKATVDIAQERLEELLAHMVDRDITDGDMVNELDAISDASGVGAWNNGQFHRISLKDFNALTKAGLDWSTWQANVGPNAFDYEIQVKINQQTHKLEYKFILTDDSASAESFKRKEVFITDSQVTTQFYFMYEKIQLEIEKLEATPLGSHNLLLVGDSRPSITTPTPVAQWFVDKINIIKNEIRKDLIGGFKNSYPLLVDDNRFAITAFVDSFASSDNSMKLRFVITDTAINLPGGAHPTSTQAYTLKVENVKYFKSTDTDKTLIGSLKLLVGRKGSIFDTNNLPGTTDVPVPSPGSNWDISAGHLSDMLSMVGHITGYPFQNFSDIYNYFKNGNVHITWEPKIQKDPDGNSELYGVMFHYSVNYFTNIFSNTENTSEETFDYFQPLERVHASQAYKDDAINAINDEKNKSITFIKLYGNDIETYVTQLEATAKVGIDAINGDISISEKEVNDIKTITIDSLQAILAAAAAAATSPPTGGGIPEDAWFEKLRALFGDNIPPDILKSIYDNQEFFKSLVEGGASLESIKMLATHKKLMQELAHINPNSITNIVNGIKSMEDNYKYTYLGLGAGLGAAGVLSGGLAVSSIRANKKLKQINNRQMKMRGTKVVSTIATLVSLSTLASSVVFMILFFVNKGGF